MHSLHRRLLSCSTSIPFGLAGLVVATIPSASFAQTSSNSASASNASDNSTDTAPREGDIIVTAQKRAQSANNVALSLVAASADVLADRQIQQTADLEKIVPGLTFTQTPSGPPVYTLRGVGFYDSSLAAAPAVSVYLDEAPLAYPVFTQVGAIDLERVEVLKGPQGTLYGENSTGGAINYIAAKPTKDFEAGGMVGLARFATFQGEAYVSGPLSDTLSARIAVRTVQSGDWQKSYTRDAELGETLQTAGRLILDWRPSSSVRFMLNVNGWVDKSDSQAFQYQTTECTVPANCSPGLENYPVAPRNARAADWSRSNPMRVDDRFIQATLRGEFDLTNQIQLITVGGYQNLKQNKWIDQDATNVDDLEFNQRGRIESYNQEIRLAGNMDRINWLVGAYYSFANVTDDFTVYTPELSTSPPGPFYFTTAGGETKQRVKSYAGFANAEYKITNHLTINAGVRYTESRRRFSGCEVSGPDPQIGNYFAFIASSLGGYPLQPVPANGCISFNKTTFVQERTIETLNQNNTSYRFGLSYQTDNHILAYANVSKGYKSGSFPTVSASSSAQFTPVTQESVLAYEAGLKIGIIPGVQLNTAAFYYDYKDKQIRGRIFDAAFGALEALVNVPKSRIYGFEADFSTRPIDGLMLSASATYVNSKVQRFVGITATGASQDFAGSAFPYAPKWQAVGDAQYKFPINASFNAFLGSSLNYHSKTYANLGEDPNFELNSYVTVDARAGLEAPNGKWKLSVYGKNVFNKYYWNNVFQFTDTRFRIAARPAEYGATLSFKF